MSADRIATLEAALAAANARIDRTIEAITYHRSMESESVEVRTVEGWTDVADLLTGEVTFIQWGNIYEVSNVEEENVYEAAESEDAARAIVAASPTDTGLVIRTCGESGEAFSGWVEIN
ncbi:hypothetical protein [Leifsonia sp. Leaf264]|uniref:hypothetical protein n=1 Tax=Leifsonia sp. Leaf264 TaxID=1736314 RepID=UPI0006F48A1B|nr:hypothetical protein [Leifsonia sp. Leaf264]KQO98433.1 hypothetical protein ASF30_10250 [Leifsonia sp. Leaf264]